MIFCIPHPSIFPGPALLVFPFSVAAGGIALLVLLLALARLLRRHRPSCIRPPLNEETSAFLNRQESGRADRHPPLNPEFSSLTKRQKAESLQQSSEWIQDKKLESVLRPLHAIVFEYHAKTKEQFISPFISEYLAGNYDGRPLSTVMLEDHVIHPKDIENSLRFREACQRGETGEITLRLLNRSGAYCWYRMVMSPCPAMGDDVFVGVLMDVDKETTQKLLLRRRVEYDQITKIYNRQKFHEATQHFLASEPDREHYLVRFDIDRFKLVNELYTNAEGDRVLCRIAELLRKAVRPGETYGRLRDDVFAFCLSRSRSETIQVIRELEETLNESTLSFHFVISAGIVPIPQYHGESMDLLCDWAVIAQRTVKGNYMIPYAFYNKAMSDSLNREHFITASMQKSLEHKEFQIYLQPQFNIQTREMIGAEALVRWNHPDSGMISPGEFIPLFEHNGFILLLDEYVWDQTYSMMSKWTSQGYQMVPVSVNVSRLHLYDPEFCGKIRALCKKYQLPPEMIHMEITESAYTECSEKLYDIMDELQAQGFSFSMDDFGSGYSSLNVLKDIPVDIVKIDLNFLQDSRQGKDVSHTILEGTIRLVQNMGLPVIAEGIETEEQLQFLKTTGCNLVQGFYFARPMPALEFETYLQKSVR